MEVCAEFLAMYGLKSCIVRIICGSLLELSMLIIGGSVERGTFLTKTFPSLKFN
jgi:hypothetical protein